MIRARHFPALAASLAVAFLSAGCGTSSSDTVVRGKRAEERAQRTYVGAEACTPGTDVELVAQPGSPTQQMVCGTVVTDPSGAPLNLYTGIQYAQSPAGVLRWTDPQPPQWTELAATAFGPKCPQGKGADIHANDVDEDCLYLNVWTPQITPQGGGTFPVMVFIHGGAFISGSGGSAVGTKPNHRNMYDGQQFVATSRTGGQPVVFVTMNYRLGVLGFLAGDTIGSAGNFGIKDQTAALQWVQRNIARFGGDPTHVMVFGESAGAQSTALHLTMPGDQGLFAHALMESNYAINYQTVHEAQTKANFFSVATACALPFTQATDLGCLKRLHLSAILDHQVVGSFAPRDLVCEGLQALIPWNPVIDGQTIVQDPILATVTKPFVVGSNLTESIPFIGGLPLKTDDEWAVAYAALMTGIFGIERAAEIVIRYDAYHPELDALGKFERTVTDYMWTCFNRNFASTAAHPGPARYRYFDVHWPSFPIWTNQQGQVASTIDVACATSPNVCHASELPFVFGNPVNMAYQLQSFTPEEATMSTQLQRYWIGFARSGNPATTGQTAWPADTTGKLLRIQAPTKGMTVEDDLILDVTAQCSDFWDKIGYVVTSAAGCTATP